jgi:cytochrome c2
MRETPARVEATMCVLSQCYVCHLVDRDASSVLTPAWLVPVVLRVTAVTTSRVSSGRSSA